MSLYNQTVVLHGDRAGISNTQETQEKAIREKTRKMLGGGADTWSE